ncbi:MAG: site-specific integrase, partial [Desulfobacteraceae bacterium]
RIGAAKDAINQGFTNNKVDAKPYKAFSGVKNLLETGSNARTETMSIEQYLNFLDTCRPWIRPLVEIAMNTGMRAGEIRALRWPFIGKDFIRIPLEFTKTNKPNTKERGLKVIPINKNVRKILNQQVRNLHNDLVFQLRGRKIPKTTLSRAFMKDCVKADIPAGRKMEGGLTFHDIRSTVKTNMANAGVDPTFRDALLGHSRKGMDTYYIQIDPKNLICHMATYERWLNSEIRQILDRGEKSSV